MNQPELPGTVDVDNIGNDLRHVSQALALTGHHHVGAVAHEGCQRGEQVVEGLAELVVALHVVSGREIFLVHV